ncbi:hypothetical protein L0F63_004107, partial [Massospora cicadina]
MTTYALARDQLASIHHPKEDRSFFHSFVMPSPIHTQFESASTQVSHPSSFDPLSHPPPPKPAPKLPLMAIEPPIRSSHLYSIANIINPINERPWQVAHEPIQYPPQPLDCELCGCAFKQSGFLYKHQWEHSSYWSYVGSLAMTKDQQIQILE